MPADLEATPLAPTVRAHTALAPETVGVGLAPATVTHAGLAPHIRAHDTGEPQTVRHPHAAAVARPGQEPAIR